MEVVRPRPDIEEDQRPEMQDRQAIAVDRPFRLLGHEIIHHRQERHGQEKGDRIVPVPPLGQRILHRSEEHTSELQSLMRISYAVFCLKKKKKSLINTRHTPYTLYRLKTK